MPAPIAELGVAWTRPNYPVVHAVPGRCRIRVARMRVDEALRSRLHHQLDNSPLVSSFRLNPACESVTIEHLGHIDALLDMLAQPGTVVVPLPVPPEDTPVVVLPGVTATRNNEAPVAGQWQLPDVPEQNSPTLVQHVQTRNQTATDPVLYVMQQVEAPPVLPVPDVAPVQTAPDAVLPTPARRQDRN